MSSSTLPGTGRRTTTSGNVSRFIAETVARASPGSTPRATPSSSSSSPVLESASYAPHNTPPSALMTDRTYHPPEKTSFERTKSQNRGKASTAGGWRPSNVSSSTPSVSVAGIEHRQKSSTVSAYDSGIGSSLKSDKGKKTDRVYTTGNDGKIRGVTASGERRRVLSKGNGKGWDWFRRDNIHSQRYQPHDNGSLDEDVQEGHPQIAKGNDTTVSRAPYFLPYHREQVDRDILRDMMLRRHVQILPWSSEQVSGKEFENFVPKRVLDVGCGITAAWIVEAAAIWPNTQFVGIDIAPVLLPLDRLPADIQSRISFQSVNFLDLPLPFPDSSFDFIRLSHVGFGVPEESWQILLDDLARCLVPNEGWIQVVESSIPSLLDTESRQWRDTQSQPSMQDETAAMGIPSLMSPSASKSGLSRDSRPEVDVLAITRTAQVEGLGEAVAATFSNSNVSLFPTSIFPAAFVLATKNVQTDGPLTLEAPITLPQPEQNWDTIEGQDEIAIRVYEHAEIDAFAADAFYNGGKHVASSTENLSMRDYVDYSKGAEEFVNNVRHRAGLARLYEERFGWICEADLISEQALAQQVEALTYERDIIRSEQAHQTIATAGGICALGMQSGDEAARLHEIERTLRESKADLDATRIRLEKGDWKDPLGSRKFGVEVLMKAGRKA